MNFNIRKGFFVALFTALAAVVSLAQNGKIENLAAQKALVSEFDVNGLKVILKHRASAPTVAAGVFLRGGSRNITKENAGIESLMLNSAVEAGKQFNRQTVRRELARTGSSMGAGLNTDYSAVSLAATRNNFSRMWEIFTDVLINPAFNTEDIERIRQQQLTGLREAETDPDSALQSLRSRVLYAGHVYANDPSGSIATISAITVADIKKYHQERMQTSRLLLVVVGDIEAAELKTLVAASFGKLPRGTYEEKAPAALDFSKGTLDIMPRTIPSNYVEGDFNAPSLSSPDYYAMLVASTILRDRVFQEVRVRRQLSYAPSATLNNAAANTGNIYVSAVDANQAVSVMLEEIKDLKNTPISAEELSGMAGQYLTTYYLGQETNGAQAGELARYELIGGGWRNSFEFLNKIRDVKPADIQAVAKKYMTNLRFVVVGNSAAIDKAVFLPPPS